MQGNGTKGVRAMDRPVDPPPAMDPAEDAGPPLADPRLPNSGPVFDPGKERESTRGALAKRVVWLLVGVVSAICLAVISGFRSWAEMEGFTASMLPAVLTITGTVLGFYFGSEERE